MTEGRARDGEATRSSRGGNIVDSLDKVTEAAASIDNWEALVEKKKARERKEETSARKKNNNF